MTGATTIGDRILDAAFEHCARITSSHYENFPVASLFLPEEKRPYIQAVYAFSRAADDFADEGDIPAGTRLELLDDWERKLDRSYEGDADHPVFIALAETVRRNHIPKEFLSALLSAFRQDVVKHRYGTIAELLDYCSRSANPVGRIVLHIFGHREAELCLLSDRICTGLQLANFWQDLGADLARDRLYVPLSEFDRSSYTEEDWAARVADDRFRAMMKSLVVMTREMFREGARLPDLTERDIALELRLVWLGGMAILRGIERSGYDVYASRPALGALDKAGILFRGFFMKDLSHHGMKKKRKKPWDLT
jgi:squalene synthase HpnC